MTKYLLDDRERNYYDDSDFYAIFWDTDTQSIRSEEYGSTRFPSPHQAPAEYLRDVPEDIRAEANAWYAARVFEVLKAEDRALVDAPEDANRGDELITLKNGAFKDKNTGVITPYYAGEKGIVIWSGAFGQFYRKGYNHPNRSNIRVGLKFEDGRVVFIGLKDCKLARDYKTDEALRETAEAYASRGQYAALFAKAGMIVI